jgi:hypothetical protein
MYKPLSRTPRCCRTRFPLLENETTRPAAGAIAATYKWGVFWRQTGSTLPENVPNNGSAWIISPSN